MLSMQNSFERDLIGQYLENRPAVDAQPVYGTARKRTHSVRVCPTVHKKEECIRNIAQSADMQVLASEALWVRPRGPSLR